jgi:hypothetical protein
VRRFAPRLCAQLFCITLLLLSVSNSHAQLPKRPSAQEQIQNRGWALSNLRRDAGVEQPTREKLLAQVALKNDFRKLQVVNNDLMKRVFKPSGTQKITEQEIRSSLGEIKKLAERLRVNFGLPKLEADEPANVSLRPGLLQLDKAIMSFVDNPLLQELRVYDAELASQAGRDLSDVSRLAEALRKLTKEK